MENRRILGIGLVLLMINLGITGCNKNHSAKNTGNETIGETTDVQVSEEDINANAELVITQEYSDEELRNEYDKSDAVSIYLSDDKMECESDKVSIEGNVITILKSGTYILEGQLSDGRVVVDSDDDGIVRLVLAGVDITSSENAPIFVKEAKETILTLAEGTLNTITDTENYELEDTENSEPNAAIFSKDDLAINGTGTLVVNANYNHGIQGKDDLIIISGTINIYSVGDGIVGKDSVVIKEADITIDSGNSGIKGTNESGGKGYVYLDNPTINVKCVADGIHSNTVVQMDGGDVTIYAEDDGIHADVKVLINGGTLKIEESYEGIEGCIIIINDGNISIISSDDGLNAANGSSQTVMTGMFGGMKDGIKQNIPDNGMAGMPDTIPDDMQGEMPGDVQGEMPGDVQGEMPEDVQGEMPEDRKGEMSKDVPDDDVDVWQEKEGGQSEESVVTSALSSLEIKLEINGGEIYVASEGDGIDSNGSVVINGGNVYVDGSENGGNGALDYESSFQVNGGVLVAVGSSQMAMAPDSSSAINTVNIAFADYYNAGTEIVVRNVNGTEIISYTPSKNFNSFIFSSDKLETDGSYVIYADGEQVDTITISDVVTASGNVSQGMGGRMEGGRGGMFGKDNDGGDRTKGR